MPSENVVQILDSIVDMIDKNNIDGAIVEVVNKMREQISNATSIDDLYKEFTDYVIESVLPQKAIIPNLIEYWLEFMNQLELLHEAGELTVKKDLIEILNTIPEMINSSEVEMAIHTLETQIQEDINAGDSIRTIQIKLIDFILDTMLLKNEINPISLEFIFGMSSYEPLQKADFIYKLMNTLRAKELEENIRGNKDFFTNAKQKERAFESNITMVMVFIKLLDRYPANKTEIIKLFSLTYFGESCLRIIMPFLLENNALTDAELSELRNLFLDTLNKNMFELLKKKDVSPIEQKKIDVLNSCSDELAEKLNFILVQIKYGFAQFHANDDSAAKYILAAIRSDKSNNYEFTPIAFNVDNFCSYIEEIFRLPKPVKESFLIMSPHWTAGSIEIRMDGTVNIFISDSLGLDDKNSYWFKDTLESTEFLRLCEGRTVNIYHALNKRQNDGESCRVYALDDVRHFYTIEQHMQENLFDYLNRNVNKNAMQPSENNRVRFCHLPDSLLRTMQSRKVTSMFHDETVNKKGETATISIEKDFHLNPQTEKLENRRLNRKYQKMTIRLEKQISKILQSDDPEQAFKQFHEMANQHTLAGLKARNDQALDAKQKSIALTHQFKEETARNKTDAGCSPSSLFENK